MEKEGDGSCGDSQSRRRSCETDKMATVVDVDAGYASSVSCAGSQTALEGVGDMDARQRVTLECPSGEKSCHVMASNSCAGRHTCIPSPILGISVNRLPLEPIDDSEHPVTMEQTDMDITVASSSWSERNGVTISEEAQTEQLHGPDNPSERSDGLSNSVFIESPIQSPVASSLLSAVSKNSWRKSRSLDDSSMSSPSIERGHVPPPPSRGKMPTGMSEGTSVDGDLDEQIESSRHSSPSTIESYSDEDTRSKSSEDDVYLLRLMEQDVSHMNAAFQFDNQPCELRRALWKDKKAHSLSPIGKAKASTLPRTDGYSSLRHSSYFPHTEFNTLELSMDSGIHRVQSCGTLAMISTKSIDSTHAIRAQSMDIFDKKSDQQSGSNVVAADKHTDNHLKPPLQKRPSISAWQTSEPKTSGTQSPRSRSRSPHPIVARVRKSFRPKTHTPTVIPNPCLDSMFSAVDNPISDYGDVFVPLDEQERSRSPRIHSIQDDNRKSFDSVLTPTPLVHVTGPGKGVHHRDVLYSLPSDREFGEHGWNGSATRRVSDPVDRNQAILQPLKHSYKLNSEITSLVVASHEDFSLCLLDCEETLKRRQQTSHRLCQFATKGWVEVLETGLTSSMQLAKIQKSDEKLRRHIWEICRTECEYFSRLLVIRDVYMETMKELKEKGHLETVSTDQLFGNLTEVCDVSGKWAELLLSLFEGKSPETAGDVLGLLHIFSQFDPAVTGPYSRYSQNYARHTHLNLLSEWQADPNLVECLKWCQKRSLVRMSLDQLLIAPVRRFSDYLLLLKDVLKSCPSKYVFELKERICNVEGSVANLNKDVKNNEVYNEVAELQLSLQWPPVSEIERTGIFVPPGLEHLLEQKSCVNFLDNGDRKILYSKALSLLRDSSSRMDIFLFLFDDLLLMTKFNSKFNSKGRQRSRRFSRLGHGTHTVYKQPLPLDRVQVHDVPSSSGIDYAFTVVHHSRFLQVIGAYTLQATSETEKNMWMTTITKAQRSWQAQLDVNIGL